MDKQFDGAVFENVTSMEIYNSVISDQSLFLKFPRLQELMIYDSELMSAGGDLNVLENTPKLRELTLSGLGEFDELVGITDLDKLRTLSLINGTVVSDMSYLNNIMLKKVKIDMSHVTALNQFKVLGGLDKLNSISIQLDKEHELANELTRAEKWISRNNEHIIICILKIKILL
jgi:hypothetical protein